MHDHPPQEDSHFSLLPPAASELRGNSRLSDFAGSAGSLSVLLNSLEGVKQIPNGWEALCPAHDDHRPSLAIKVAADGKVLVHCRARCTTTEVMEAIGLEWKDLFPPGPTSSTRKRQEVAGYVYREADGTPALKVLRFKPKDFRQQCWDGKDWSWKGAKPKLPYRLPELLAEPGRAVFVVEGEKDADNLAKLNLLVTCSPWGCWQVA